MTKLKIFAKDAELSSDEVLICWGQWYFAVKEVDSIRKFLFSVEAGKELIIKKVKEIK